MPGTEDGEPVLLPVDAKFPREAWERLEDAQNRCDQAGMKDAGTKLESVVRASAKTSKEKYIDPPTTTNFAVMFLTKGLFAEVVRRPGLVDDLQSTFHVPRRSHHVCGLAYESANGVPHTRYTKEGQRGLEAARSYEI